MITLSPDTLWIKNFDKIALSQFVSKINTFLRLTQKFKMATKLAGKLFFAKLTVYFADTLSCDLSDWLKNMQ